MISGIWLKLSIAALVSTTSANLGWSQLLNNPETLRASTSTMVPASTLVVPAPNQSPNVVRLSPEMRGDIYMARKMFREAIEKFRECPPSAAVDNKIGIAFHQLLQLELAKRSYQAAMKLDPKFPQPVNNLGTVYYSQRNYGKAMKFYRKALRLDDNSASVWVNLGSAYFAKHDIKHAAECYDKAMQLDPEVFEHRSQYGTLLQERTVEDRAKFHLYLAKAYAQRGDKEKALIYLRKALEEGLKERKNLPDMPEFASLKTDDAFVTLLRQNPQPL
jgi:tetratricopeptide (TPR) repeat protein